MSELFPKDVEQYIRDHVQGVLSVELTVMVNREFGTEYTVNQIRWFKKNHHLSSGLKTCFKKGGTPHNKGKKGIRYAGCEKTWFKQGRMPHNHKPVGTERIDSKDGYIMVKVAEPKHWKFKHRIVWEENNGPIPAGHAIIFLDGNKLNCSIENLRMVNRGTLVRLNQNHLFTDNARANESAIALAQLLAEIGSAKKRRKHRDQPRKNPNDEQRTACAESGKDGA